MENKAKIVEFWASWCQPCKIMKPLIEEAKETYNQIDFEIIQLDSSDMNQEKLNSYKQEYGLNSIPAVFFLKDDRIVDKQIGIVSKTQLFQKIDALI